MQDKSINVGGSFRGVANTGDNSVIQNNWNSVEDQDVADFMIEMLKYLSQRYPKASEVQRQTVLQMELQQSIRENPTLKQRFLSAIRAGGFELAKVLTDNPFVGVPIETVKGWIEAEPG